MTDDPLPPPAESAAPRWLTLHSGIRTVWRIGTAIATPLVASAVAGLARALQEAVALPLPWWAIGLLDRKSTRLNSSHT